MLRILIQWEIIMSEKIDKNTADLLLGALLSKCAVKI